VDTILVSRYPGAQPFADNDTSRLVFFGRSEDSLALLNLVLAHRLVVVYAKSGLGKTSLLQAGLAQRLRDENCLPLAARLNVASRAPLVIVTESIEHEARRQGIEHHATPSPSLWHYFKTAEFWHGDRLMTPVLVLDQFEEVFTLVDQDARAGFLTDLGFLIRGVRPPAAGSSADPDGSTLSEKPPNVRVVIALREEFLGLLEEAADDIPQIFDHRFRLRPLSIEAAAEAIEGPAAKRDGRFNTRPFRYAPGTITAIVDALSVRNRTNGAPDRAHTHIEPFHLQLVCQHAEEIASERQRRAAERQRPDAMAPGREAQDDGAENVTVSFEDLGGRDGVSRTLREFYNDITHSFRPFGTRRRVKRLCADYLINPEGRRLSVEQGEIKRTLNLDAGTLKTLVDRRLLRADQRADGWYFELSHDSLVEPILATSMVRSMTLGGLGLLASVVEGVVALAFLFVGLVNIGPENIGVALFGAPLVGLALWHAFFGAERSVETLRRHVRITAGSWAICGYAAFVSILWTYNVAFGKGRQDPASVQIMELAQISFLIGAAIALVRGKALAVALLAANVVTIIATSILRYPSDVQNAYGGASTVLIADALYFGLGAASLAYAWFLHGKRLLR
jgi:hypothetical protein